MLKISFFRCGSLRPSSQKVISLVAELKALQKNNETLEKDKEHLRINLLSAEEEVRRAEPFKYCYSTFMSDLI